MLMWRHESDILLCIYYFLYYSKSNFKLGSNDSFYKNNETF